MLHVSRPVPASIDPLECLLPLAEISARAGIAGFPSPAQDYVSDTIDLNHTLIPHPAATYLVTATGDSMQTADGAGIQSGDLLVVDRSPEPRHGDIVIAVIDGEMVVKELRTQHGCPRLHSANPAYAPIPLATQDIRLWGVVTSLIRRFRR
ncbi:LexA family protein [Kushneria aurantia]|uniref:LexA family protein n=1 Tax=Kushneria aurantia TaxID=504092 RepID=A0ABV6G4K5_9GAMM|nr:translesion error-prone DNA polymerase V autoproteolytic subunit [Kushneria aurantia]